MTILPAPTPTPSESYLGGMTQSHHGCLSGEDLESLRSLGAGSLVAQVAQAGLCPCAFVPSCQLETVFGGALALLPLGSLPGPKPTLLLGKKCFGCVKIVAPRRSHAGKKEVGQKHKASLWCEDCHMPETFEGPGGWPPSL